MTAETTNPFAVAGRLKKAYEIARVLHRAEITPESAKLMTPGEWARVAGVAGCKPASVETQAIVLEKIAKLAEPIDWERVSA